MRRSKGFTLVEIMIVVAIIALLAAIAIPNLLRARLQANESASQAALKTIATAEISYRSANATYGTLAEMGADNPPYIDSTIAAGSKSGYTIALTVGTEEFYCTAVPITPNVSGVREFCITEDGVVRVGTAADHAACAALPSTS